MDDLISRQAAIDAFAKRTGIEWEKLKILEPMLCILENLPSAERHGRWIKKYRGNYLCSVCGAWFRTTDDYGNIINGEMDSNYCETCGAKMDEVEDE